MNNESAKALTWTAGALIVLAFVIMSPTGAFALLTLAAVCAAIPAVFASKRPRVIALVLLLASLALAIQYYPLFERDREAYATRSKARATPAPVVTPTEQDVTKK